MFRLTKILNGRANVAEMCMLPTTASETYSIGEALSLTGGKLTKCAATVTPTHIAAQDYIAPATDALPLFVFPVSSDMVFECPVGAAPTTLAIGSKVTLSADALGVTATTTSGVATILDLCAAKNAGDKILIKF